MQLCTVVRAITVMWSCSKYFRTFTTLNTFFTILATFVDVKGPIVFNDYTNLPLLSEKRSNEVPKTVSHSFRIKPQTEMGSAIALESSHKQKWGLP